MSKRKTMWAGRKNPPAGARPAADSRGPFMGTAISHRTKAVKLIAGNILAVFRDTSRKYS